MPGFRTIVAAFLAVWAVGGCGGSGSARKIAAGFYKGTVTVPGTTILPIAISVAEDGTIHGDGYAKSAGTEAWLRISPASIPGQSTVVNTGDQVDGVFSFKADGGAWDVSFHAASAPFSYVSGKITAAPLPSVGIPGNVPTGSYSGEYVLLDADSVVDYGIVTATVNSGGQIVLDFSGADWMEGASASGDLATNGVLANAVVHIFSSDEPQTGASYGFDQGALTIGMDLITAQNFKLRAWLH